MAVSLGGTARSAAGKGEGEVGDRDGAGQGDSDSDGDGHGLRHGPLRTHHHAADHADLAPAHGDVKWRPVHGVPRFGLPREPLSDTHWWLPYAARRARACWHQRLSTLAKHRQSSCIVLRRKASPDAASECANDRCMVAVGGSGGAVAVSRVGGVRVETARHCDTAASHPPDWTQQRDVRRPDSLLPR